MWFMQVSWRSTTRCLPRPKGVQNKSSSLKHRGLHTGTWYRYSNICCDILDLVWVSISFFLIFVWSCYHFWYQEACNSFLRALCSFFRAWCLASCIVLWGNTDVWLRRNHHGQTTSAWLLHGDLKPAAWQTTKSLDRQTSNLVCSCLSGTVARGAIKVFDSWAFELIQCEQKFGLAGIIILLF